PKERLPSAFPRRGPSVPAAPGLRRAALHPYCDYSDRRIRSSERRAQRAELEEIVDLSLQIAQLTLANPLIAASGCFGYGVEYSDVLDLASLGGVAVKGMYLTGRAGPAPPRMGATPA